MTIQIRMASPDDAPVIAALVMDLTAEISQRCDVSFQRDAELTSELCARWIRERFYIVLIAYVNDKPVGIATLAESYALYAGGKIGILQECYVAPEQRSQGVGQRLIEGAAALASERGWAAMELCTPPLPQFQRAIDFYQQYGFNPVGGRKMRRQCGAKKPA
ncbi:MAG: GNAT family N-acetyltransferase [Pseudomonadota bacterium]